MWFIIAESLVININILTNYNVSNEECVYCAELESLGCQTSGSMKGEMGQSIMEQCALQNVNNCLNTNIYSYLETSGGQSSNLYLNAVHFFNTRLNLTSLAA